MQIFDSHAHYDDKQFDLDRDEIIKNLQENEIAGCINIGCDIDTSKKACNLAEKYDFIYAAVGIHPSEIAKTKEEINSQISEIEKIAQTNEKVVCIGEIGLDYYWYSDNKELQKYSFVNQIELANKLKLPISIHTRDAIDDTINIIKNKIKIQESGVLHCCPFNRELVKHGLEAGLFIAFGGTCTFKNAKNAEEIIKMVPDDRLLIETDSPYLAPDPVRGTRNDSRNLKYVIKKLATVREKGEEEIAKLTFENAKKLFKL